MPAIVKPYKCIGCSTTNSDNFYKLNKSWCKYCYRYRVKGEAIKKYECRECGTKDLSKFYEYLKCICKECKYPRIVERGCAKISPARKITIKILEEP